jgi:hypothetical protein
MLVRANPGAPNALPSIAHLPPLPPIPERGQERFWTIGSFIKTNGSKSTTPIYFEDALGRYLGDKYSGAVSSMVRSRWATLFLYGRHPPSWDVADSECRDYVLIPVLHFYVDLRRCEDGICKLHKWCIDHYPSWYAAHCKGKNLITSFARESTLPQAPVAHRGISTPNLCDPLLPLSSIQDNEERPEKRQRMYASMNNFVMILTAHKYRSRQYSSGFCHLEGGIRIWSHVHHPCR